MSSFPVVRKTAPQGDGAMSDGTAKVRDCLGSKGLYAAGEGLAVRESPSRGARRSGLKSLHKRRACEYNNNVRVSTQTAVLKTDGP